MSDISFYPKPPDPGSNAFGKFAFGVSPFGEIRPFNWRDTIITQYANSAIMLSMIESWFDSIDQTQDIENFYDNIWNIHTAISYGLDIWGVIVGISRNVHLPQPGNYFGFEQGLTWDTLGPGGISPFYVGQPLTSTYTFTDAAYRQLIIAKALANICDGSIPSINAILLSLFGPGNPFGADGEGGECYVTNGMDMTMTFTFDFDLNPVQTSIIYQSGVLPIPSGVTASIVVP